MPPERNWRERRAPGQPRSTLAVACAASVLLSFRGWLPTTAWTAANSQGGITPHRAHRCKRRAAEVAEPALETVQVSPDGFATVEEAAKPGDGENGKSWTRRNDLVPSLRVPRSNSTVQDRFLGQYLDRLRTANKVLEVAEKSQKRWGGMNFADSLEILHKLLELSNVNWKVVSDSCAIDEIVSLQERVLQNDMLQSEVVIEAAVLGKTLLAKGLPQGQQIEDQAIEAILTKPLVWRKIGIVMLLRSELAVNDWQIRQFAIQQVKTKLHQFDPTLVLETVQAIVRHPGERDEELLEMIDVVAEKKVPRMTPEHKIGVVYAFAKLRWKPIRFLHAITYSASQNIGTFEVWELGNLAYSLTRFEYRDEQILGALARATTWKGRKMTPSTLSTILWCLGSLGFRDEKLLSYATTTLLWMAEQGVMPSVALSRSLVSFALMQYADADFLEKASTILTDNMQKGLSRTTSGKPVRLQQLGPDSIGFAAWAFAKLGYRNDAFLEAAGTFALKERAQMGPSGISHILVAFALFDHQKTKLIATLLGRAAEVLHMAQAADVPRIVWALATLGKPEPKPDFLARLAQHAVTNIATLNAEQLADLSWGFARLGKVDAAVSNAIVRQAVVLKKDLSGADWMSLVLSSEPRNALKLLNACDIIVSGKKKNWLDSQSDRGILALSWMVQNSPCQVPDSLRKAVLEESGNRPASEEDKAFFTKDGRQLDRQASQSPLAHSA